MLWSSEVAIGPEVQDPPRPPRPPRKPRPEDAAWHAWAEDFSQWAVTELREIRRALALMTQATESASGPARPRYTITNRTEDRTFDADTVAVAELADVVGTLLADLQGGDS